MAIYSLTSRDPSEGAVTVSSILAHLAPLGIVLTSVHYESGVWVIVVDKDFPEKERAHFESTRTQTVFTKGGR